MGCFFVEHLILALKFWMTFIVPSMPSDVKEKVRLEREIIKKNEIPNNANCAFIT
jgi:hypothetical protein